MCWSNPLCRTLAAMAWPRSLPTGSQSESGRSRTVLPLLSRKQEEVSSARNPVPCSALTLGFVSSLNASGWYRFVDDHDLVLVCHVCIRVHHVDVLSPSMCCRTPWTRVSNAKNSVDVCGDSAMISTALSCSSSWLPTERDLRGEICGPKALR